MLSPYRVLDLTDDRGVFAGLILAALGAEVIAVEPVAGGGARRRGPFLGGGEDPERSFWHLAFDRGKRSVTRDAVDLDALAADADVLLESGAVPIDLDALRRVNPGLVTVSITPFGRGGPKDDWVATDLVIMAAGCTLALGGDDDRPPVRLPCPQSWLHASSDAACGALVALWERATSGLGQHVDVSAQVSIAQATQSYILAESFRASKSERFGGGVRSGGIRLPLVFPAKDGHVAVTLVFGSAIGPFTARLMRWVHEAGHCDEAMRDTDWIGFGALLSGGQVRPADWAAVTGAVAAFTAARTKAELFAGALERRVLLAPVATPHDVLDSPQLAERGYWETVVAGGRPLRAPGRFARLTATPLPPLGGAPTLGQHNRSDAARPRGPGPVRTPATEPGATRAGDGRADPFAGLKVLDLMWVMAGPAVTRALADFGAKVVRIESAHKPDTARTIGPFYGDEPGLERSALYQNMNAGKLDLAVDLDRPEGREVVYDLVRWADVVTESFSPGVVAGWGLDYESVRRINPGVVMMSSCLMGQTGPLNRFAGYGNLAAALCGFTGLVGWPDRPPAGPFGAYTDYLAPRVSLATLIAALDHRRRTGEGQYIDFAQGEGALHFLAPVLLEADAAGRDPARVGNADADLAPHGVYRAAGEDGWVAVACDSDEQWRRLAGHLGRADLAGLSRAERRDRDRELDRLVEGWTSTRSAPAAQDELQAIGVPAHAVQNSPECRADPQLAALGHFAATDHAELGSVEVEASRLFLRSTPPRVSAAPTIGQHGLEVLEGILGYSPERVTELLVSGALE